jgi:broad specificity phosphatase PhoE
LSKLYLIRHGQAGLRHDYDRLSNLGQTQSRRLGEYLAAQGLRFDAVYAGQLTRQQQTAEEVSGAYRNAGVAFPEIVTDPTWNEFDLDQVYRDLAPQLSAADPVFRAEYEEMLRQAEDHASEIHRTWSNCDMAVVRAWIAGRHACNGESWMEFQQRVTRSHDRLQAHARGETVAVFTSATPISIWIGAAMGVNNGRVLRLAGVMYNSAVSSLRLRDGDMTLFSFNSAAHLPPELRTFR